MAFIKLTQLSIPKSIALRLGTFVSAKKQRAVPLYAEKFFGIRKVLALRGWVAFPSHATKTTRLMTTTKKRIGRPTTTDPRVHRYNFKLTTEENIRFKQMLCKAGLEHNRSRFIVKRIFKEEFVVIKRDPSKTQFVARLNDFYFQFQKLGNNYNQIVKAINAHFSNVAIPHQIAMLEQRTRELKALSIEILNLAKQAKEWLRI